MDLDAQLSFPATSGIEVKPRERGLLITVPENLLRLGAENSTLLLTALTTALVSSGDERAETGRGGIKRVQLSENRAAVIRQYLRGGLMARFSKRHFFRLGKPRPISELEVNQILLKASVAVAVPLAASVEFSAGGFCYLGALATLEIPEAENLLPLSLTSNSNSLLTIAENAGRVARAALNAGYEHADCHLGNVLVAKGKSYLIDWDKARVADQASTERIEARFRRSVLKHGVAAEIAFAFSTGLGKS